MTPTLPARSATGADVAVLAAADRAAPDRAAPDRATAAPVPMVALSPTLPSPNALDNDGKAAAAPPSTATVLPTAASAMPSAAVAALAPFQHQLLALHAPPRPADASVPNCLARDPSARAPPPLARAEANARAGALKHPAMHANAPSPHDSGNGTTTHEPNGTARSLAPITPLSLASVVPARSPTQHIPCKFYKAGLCSAGTNCSFSHTRDPMASPAICKYHAKGACKFGTKCALAHLGPPAMLAGFGAALGNGGSTGGGSANGNGNGNGSAPSTAAAAAAALEALLSPPPVANTSFVQQMQHHQQQKTQNQQLQQLQQLQQQQLQQQQSQHLPSYSSSVAPPRSPVPSPLQHRSFRLSLTAASTLSNSHGGHHYHQDLPSPSARSPARMRRASTLSASYAGLSGYRASAASKPLLSTSSLHRANGTGGAPWSPLPPLPTPTSSAGPGLSLSVSTAALPPLSSSLSASLTSPNPWSPYSTSSPARPEALDMARLHGGMSARDMPLPPPSPHHGYQSSSSRMLPPASFGALPPPPASPLPPGTGPVSASYSAGFATGLGLSYGSFSFQDDAFPADRRRGSDHHHHQMPHTPLDRRFSDDLPTPTEQNDDEDDGAMHSILPSSLSDLLTPTEQLRFSSQRRVPASMAHAAPAAFYPGVLAVPGELRKSDSAVLLEEEAIFSMEALDAALMSPTAAHASTAAAAASATSSWR
ncbi:hypothetical protein AMAG_01154 [Allomyces macrogynus ATCC 38327]|uniref:C3H1-type domain-containing protein n=1 Tax=Allomyces macrogynus (strain ATCC 38327) TaxID=578462 RepID=A0A0L0RYL4_ALLM3|nr:hypothetical protein AMAG_01154 [Allomyces macrogynus ATCC 38327]|eukprot:KNE55240.1 hypothetical protein AMAG_01154 [Allomyces macrogynus ATCC 38327]